MELTQLEITEVLRYINNQGYCFRFGKDVWCYKCIIKKIAPADTICRGWGDITSIECKLPYILKYVEDHPEQFFDKLL